MADPERPFTPRSLAEHWQCSQQHVYNLVARGDLPSFRLGKLIRIPRYAVEAIDRGETWCSPGKSEVAAPRNEHRKLEGRLMNFRIQRAVSEGRQKR